ncbi:DUF1349 domain-containing protein [Halomicroarcula sp. GCM10025817]|uniref:DUF1349 domain-containing protein n=1 Tax=Haloarcula TaxID=2237 RepID=UPI0023E7B98A|nr:DUF1349 domain-containing protein [Halomicroarcula sp. SYNS111]
MQWDNEPETWAATDDEVRLTVPGDTDCWRVTRHDFIADDAPFYYRVVDGDFTATVRVAGDYDDQYDQVGLMVRESETHWLKCGVEVLDGVQQASAVLTRDYSDWSVLPLEEDPGSVWVRVERIGATLEVSYSLDGDDYAMIRQGYLSDADTLQVGPMAAAPQGDGFEAVFEEFTVEQ